MPPASPPGRPSLTLKICLAGDPAVGKTSLVRRFVSNTFDDRYLATLGAKVSSRRFPVADPTRPGTTHDVGAAIWDIMGSQGFRDLLRDAFFHQAQGVLLVADATRPETLRSLPDWYATIRSVAGIVPAVVLLNKWDLVGERRVGKEAMEEVCGPRGWPWLPTSARTGENVEEGFAEVVHRYLLALARGTPAAGPAGA